jgi:hypothetical protein
VQDHETKFPVHAEPIYLWQGVAAGLGEGDLAPAQVKEDAHVLQLEVSKDGHPARPADHQAHHPAVRHEQPVPVELQPPPVERQRHRRHVHPVHPHAFRQDEAEVQPQAERRGGAGQPYLLLQVVRQLVVQRRLQERDRRRDVHDHPVRVGTASADDAASSSSTTSTTRGRRRCVPGGAGGLVAHGQPVEVEVVVGRVPRAGRHGDGDPVRHVPDGVRARAEHELSRGPRHGRWQAVHEPTDRELGHQRERPAAEADQPRRLRGRAPDAGVAAAEDHGVENVASDGQLVYGQGALRDPVPAVLVGVLARSIVVLVASVAVQLVAGVAGAWHDGVGGGELGVEDRVELAVAADAGLALHPDEVAGRVDGHREEVLRRAGAELDQVLAAPGHQRGLACDSLARLVRGSAARARHDPRSVEAALHGAPDELLVREVGGRRGVHARQLEVERPPRSHRAAARREDWEGEEEQE